MTYIPDGLEDLIHTDPAVAAHVEELRAGKCTEVEMWRKLALFQTRAKADLLREACCMAENFSTTKIPVWLP